MLKKTFLAIFFLLLAVFCLDKNVFAQVNYSERIDNFVSNINVEQAGTILVTEEITVYANSDQIKHGIYRDFPTIYNDKLGNKYKINFSVVSVKRDGQTEAYHVANQGNGIRVYLGQADFLLSPGEYKYELTYRVDWELGFFVDHDELFWNVTGSGWSFPIYKSEAFVTLPFSIDLNQIKTTAYAGKVGSFENQGVSSSVSSNGKNNLVHFQNSNTVVAGEDFSIVIDWPRGLVTEPTQTEKNKRWLYNNLSLIFSFLGLVIVFVYYLYVWNKYGRDPKSKTIVAQYEPPKGMSPAEMRFLIERYFDDKCLVADIIDLAVKGFIKIENKTTKFLFAVSTQYTLAIINKNFADSRLSQSQQLLLLSLFKGRDLVDLGQYDALTVDAKEAFRKCLDGDRKKEYFTDNINYLKKGLLLSIFATSLPTLSDGPGVLVPVIFMTFWLLGWSLGIIILLFFVAKSWTNFFKVANKRISNLFGAIFASLFLIPFVFTELIVINFFSQVTSVGLTFVLVVIMVLNIIFYFLLKQYTVKGLDLVEQIKGFKLFLSVTEKERMNFHNPPERTSELFEKYLPYALALDVENKWAEQFAEVFTHQEVANRHPSWYDGSIYSSAFTSSFTSGISSSIASSSTTPGSSGGGGSGGGGGGGGGGGW